MDTAKVHFFAVLLNDYPINGFFLHCVLPAMAADAALAFQRAEHGQVCRQQIVIQPVLLIAVLMISQTVEHAADRLQALLQVLLTADHIQTAAQDLLKFCPQGFDIHIRCLIGDRLRTGRQRDLTIRVDNCRFSCNAAKNHGFQTCVAAQAVCTVDAAGHFAAGQQS